MGHSEDTKRRRLERLKRKQKKLADLLSQAEELASFLEFETDGLREEDLPDRPSQASSRVAEELTWTPRPDGRAIVHIDGKDHVLTALPFALLVLLADLNGGKPCDHAAPWQQLRVVRQKLSSEIGHALTPSSFSTLVWRLRVGLGKDRDLVQTRKLEGLIRFALRPDAE